MIQHENRESAGNARLSAAWDCDDAEKLEYAIACRNAAANDLSACKPFADTESGITLGAVFVDVLRRASRFEEALAESHVLSNSASIPDVVKKVLNFQELLCERKDSTAHQVSEAIEGMT